MSSSSTDGEMTETPENKCIFQCFEWHAPADGKHYERLRNSLKEYKRIGINALWLPPACKASSPESNGYDVYDLYDLGEFDQKGSIATKWGSKDELLQIAQRAKELGIDLYFDAVLNHKACADRTEKCQAVKVEEKDRTKEIECPKEIESWLAFDFPGRGDKHSSQKYHWYHFTGIDWDQAAEESSIFKILGDNKDWAQDVDNEKGNYDYLMFANLDYTHPEVVDDVKNWGVWVTNELSLAGFRLDAVRHFSSGFVNTWIGHINKTVGGSGLFFVGEFWKYSVTDLCKFLDGVDHKMSLYDPCLIGNFLDLSRSEKGDLRCVFKDTLVEARPKDAVTLVMNHDTQPGQVMDSPIEMWFRPLAYALILLRVDGCPNVWYGDLYGIRGPEPHGPTCGGQLADLILARKLYAYGKQRDYFDKPNSIGWTRQGTWDRENGLAVIMSNAGPATKKMYVGLEHAGETWTDVLSCGAGPVVIRRSGKGIFHCSSKSIAVFVKCDAEGRDEFGKFDNNIYCK